MQIILDCGTTNTKIYFIEDKKSITERYLHMGIKDVARSNDKTKLKMDIWGSIRQILSEIDRTEDNIERIIAYGMLTSEMGFEELPHAPVPAGCRELARNALTVYDDLAGRKIPVTYIRGLKNDISVFDNAKDRLLYFDFMRGEETQAIGVLNQNYFEPPFNIIILSSHSKLIKINERAQIAASYTTMSGQYYQMIKENSSIGKSLIVDEKPMQYTEDDLICLAEASWTAGGFTRSTMLVRFMDVLGGYSARDRDIFIQALLIWEDMNMIDLSCRMNPAESDKFVIIGQQKRVRLFEKILKKHVKEELETVLVTKQEDIKNINISGALSIYEETERLQ